MTQEFDVIIIGAGLVGLSIAYQMKLRTSSLKVLVIEKELDVAMHQSGNNSGVIHSGIYYKPGSLKATNCIAGYNSIIDFAEEHGIAYDICGKIIVASNNAELAALDNIYSRGIKNGLQGLKYLSKEEICEVEPHCVGVRAIKVPQTGIIDYPAVALKLKQLFISSGGQVVFGQRVLCIKKEGVKCRVLTDRDEFIAKKIVSCAGLYSDSLTKMTDKKNDVIIIPFRGEYYELKSDRQHLVKHLIYPVPDANFPFLGVHFTRMIQGGVEAGPNAVLAFKKEGYKFFDINLSELSQTLTWPGFYKIIMKYGRTGMGEIYRSLSKGAFTQALQKLIPEIKADDLIKGGAGIRAQACNREGILLDDFDIVKNGAVIHVRNAPSPAATSCLAIGNKISDLVLSNE